MTSARGKSHKWLKAMRLGQKHFQRGKFMEAQRHFRDAVRAAPDNPEAWVNLGVAQMESGLLQEAAASLERATRIDAGLMQAYLAMGDLHRLAGRWENAVQAYRKAVGIEGAPQALNKLGCALRVLGESGEAETLYWTALRTDPQFTLARVNLAALLAEQGRLDESDRQLRELAAAKLSPEERAELETVDATVRQFRTIAPAIGAALESGDPSALYAVLTGVPEEHLEVDGDVIAGIQRYARVARQLQAEPADIDLSLPEEWPLIEALFMIPYVETVPAYNDVRERLRGPLPVDGDLFESLRMEAVVVAARSARSELRDPVKAEMHLRYWHALATRDVPGMVPGQFKITGNMVMGHEHRARARPHLVTGTLRHYFGEIYGTLPPGVSRGLVTMMALSDIHPFADGNGRLAQMMLNRELEWARQMPVLFTRKMGIAGGEFTAATRNLRLNEGSIEDVIAVVKRGQRLARDFCAELSG